MDDQSETSEFLKSRRARIEPEQVGFPRGKDRRVPGLRRGEAAALAGVSVEYYARLERGGIGGASPAVLDGLANALLMNEVEKAHLYRLAQSAGSGPRSRRAGNPAAGWRPSPSIQWMLDSMETSVAMIGNGRTDLLAWNTLGGALMDEMLATATTPIPNFARFIFLEPGARRFYRDWDAIARVNVAQLRTEAGRAPHDKALHDLVGELSTRSDRFRSLWSEHDVWQNDSGAKRFHHHLVGDLTLHYNGLDVVGAPAVQLTALTAEPGSPDHDALRLLRSTDANRSRERPSARGSEPVNP